MASSCESVKRHPPRHPRPARWSAGAEYARRVMRSRATLPKDWGRHLIVEPDAALAATYRRAPRGEAWAAVSGRIRIAALVCAVCERRPPTIGGLDGAHLVSEFEMFLIGR